MLSHLERVPEPKHSQSPSHHRAGPALRHDQRNIRPLHRPQLLSWNPGPTRGSDPRLLPNHLNGPWHVVCVQEGAGLVTENFHVINHHHCAVLHNKYTFERVHADSGRFARSGIPRGRRGHGCYRRAPTSWSPKRSHQQRARQAEIRLSCPAPLGPRLVFEGWCGGAHWRLQQGL